MDANQAAAAIGVNITENPNALLVSLLIMAVAALIGGAAAYLTRDVTADGESELKTLFWRFILLGVVAAACVPLFLSLVKSRIMESILTDNQHNQLESYLIFTGLCLVAAYSARTFITSLSQRVLQDLQDVKQTAKTAKATALDAKEVAQEVALEAEDLDAGATESTPEIQADLKTDISKEPSGPSVTPDERRVLEPLSRKTYRTRTGVAEDSGIRINRISEVLEDLAAKKLALETKSPRTGGQRWAISKRGERALSRPQ